MEEVINQQNNFILIADLQDELLNLDFMNKEEVNLSTQKLLSSSLLNTKITFRSVLISIYTCYLCRPHSDNNYIDIFIEVAKSPKNNFTSDDYIANFSNKFFIYKLYESKLITLESIYAKSLHSEIFSEFFFPEIHENYPNSKLLTKEAYDKMQNSINNEGYRYDEKDVQSYLNKFIEFRSKGLNPNLISDCIRNDDIGKLQKLLSQTNTPINSIIKKSIFERYIFIEKDEPTLVEYACYYGSFQCFKFLFQQLQTIPESVSIYAVAGGNYEIIHIIERSHIKFSNKSLRTSIRFFQPEITAYLEETLNFEKTIDDACQSIIFYNLRSLIDCEKAIKKNPNDHDLSGYTPLILASMNGDIDVVKYLMTTFDEIDVNVKDSKGNTALFYPSLKGHLDTVKYLSSLPNFDINATNNNKYTALHYACQGGNLDVVKLLCSVPNIDINADCDRNLRPIDVAAKNGYIEIINYLAELPNAIIYDINCKKRSLIEHSVVSRNLAVVKLILDLVDKSLGNSKDIKNIEEFKNEDEIYHKHMMNAYNDACANKTIDIIILLETEIFDYSS